MTNINYRKPPEKEVPKLLKLFITHEVLQHYTVQKVTQKKQITERHQTDFEFTRLMSFVILDKFNISFNNLIIFLICFSVFVGHLQ